MYSIRVLALLLSMVFLSSCGVYKAVQHAEKQEETLAARREMAAQLDDRELVMEIQRDLAVMGCNPGPIDGIIGQKTLDGASAKTSWCPIITRINIDYKDWGDRSTLEWFYNKVSEYMVYTERYEGNREEDLAAYLAEYEKKQAAARAKSEAQAAAMARQAEEKRIAEHHIKWRPAATPTKAKPYADMDLMNMLVLDDVLFFRIRRGDSSGDEYYRIDLSTGEAVKLTPVMKNAVAKGGYVGSPELFPGAIGGFIVRWETGKNNPKFIVRHYASDGRFVKEGTTDDLPTTNRNGILRIAKTYNGTLLVNTATDTTLRKNVKYSMVGNDVWIHYSNKIEVWDAEKGDMVLQIVTPSKVVRFMPTPDGQHVAAVLKNRVVVYSRQGQKQFDLRGAFAEMMFFSSDGRVLTLINDNVIESWDWAQENRLYSEQIEQASRLSPYGRYHDQSPGHYMPLLFKNAKEVNHSLLYVFDNRKHELASPGVGDQFMEHKVFVLETYKGSMRYFPEVQGTPYYSEGGWVSVTESDSPIRSGNICLNSSHSLWQAGWPADQWAYARYDEYAYTIPQDKAAKMEAQLKRYIRKEYGVTTDKLNSAWRGVLSTKTWEVKHAWRGRYYWMTLAHPGNGAGFKSKSDCMARGAAVDAKLAAALERDQQQQAGDGGTAGSRSAYTIEFDYDDGDASVYKIFKNGDYKKIVRVSVVPKKSSTQSWLEIRVGLGYYNYYPDSGHMWIGRSVDVSGLKDAIEKALFHYAREQYGY